MVTALDSLFAITVDINVLEVRFVIRVANICVNCLINANCIFDTNCNSMCDNNECNNDITVLDCTNQFITENVTNTTNTTTVKVHCALIHGTCEECDNDNHCGGNKIRCAARKTCEICGQHDHCRSNENCNAECVDYDCMDIKPKVNCSFPVEFCQLDAGVCVGSGSNLSINSKLVIVMVFFGMLIYL